MIVKVLQSGDAPSRSEVVVLPGVGACEICDDAKLTTDAQLTAWLASARSAATASTLLVRPRLNHINLSPDNHVYLALDADLKVAAQITAS